MPHGTRIKVVFFDARDTLGEVDSPGHLIPYRPSTEKLLGAMQQIGFRLGVITNLPEDVSAIQGKAMVTEAILSQNEGTGVLRTIGDFIEAEHVITNHEAGAAKPDAAIYRYAAEKLGAKPEDCLFLGENLIEILGARAAGMQAQLKPCPPGREFLPAPLGPIGRSPTDSGRAFEAFFEHEHLLGMRIFACGTQIVERLRALLKGQEVPQEVRAAMGFYVYLIDNFVDQVHLRAEEAVLPVAVARGMDPKRVEWVLNQHDQARAYFRALDVAWRRIETGDADDRWYAIGDFWRTLDAFVTLFTRHAIRENDELYPEVGSYLGDADDSLVLGIVSRMGPPDITPYVAMVGAMESALGLGAH
jgi:HAD superfamily hydrolase (TIGR01549 family)